MVDMTKKEIDISGNKPKLLSHMVDEADQIISRDIASGRSASTTPQECNRLGLEESKGKSISRVRLPVANVRTVRYVGNHRTLVSILFNDSFCSRATLRLLKNS